MKLMIFFKKKSWLALKLKVFFTTSKTKKLRANRLTACQPELALRGPGSNGPG